MHVHKTGQPLRRFTPAAHYPTISSDVRVPYTCGRSRLVTAPQRQRCAVWLTCTVQPSVLNAAARSIAGLRCSDHITDNTLASFHWLKAPVGPVRVQYKLATIVYRSLNGTALYYLAADLVPADYTFCLTCRPDVH